MAKDDRHVKIEDGQVLWNPWIGCKWASPGCNNCYISKKYPNAFNKVKFSKTQFNLPVRMTRELDPDKGKNVQAYKFKENTVFKVCEYSDFFIEDADYYRKRAWKVIRARKDCLFNITTKRIYRFLECIPDNWGEGWYNVAIGVSIYDQASADFNVSKLIEIPAKYRYIEVAPLVSDINLKRYLSSGLIDKVIIRGETGEGHQIRECDLTFVKDIQEQCNMYGVHSVFKKTGSKLLNNKVTVRIKPDDEEGMAAFYNYGKIKEAKVWMADKLEIENLERIEKAAEVYSKITKEEMKK